MPGAEHIDDERILPQYSLWRRIPPRHLVPDENIGGVRISSAAFDDEGGDPMSAVIGDWVLRDGREPRSVLAGYDDFGLAMLTAELVRSKQQKIVHSPEENEPNHALVVGKKTGSVRKYFAKNATWVIKSPGHVVLAIPRLPGAWTAGKNAETAQDLLLPP